MEQSGSMQRPVAKRPVTQWRGAAATRRDDALAVEEPLEIRIGDQPLAITMRTPGHDRELAAGFCWTEGIVGHPDDIEDVSACALADYGNIVRVRLTPEAMAARREQLACATRESYLSSSCGLCGKQSIDRIRQHVAPIRGDFSIAAATLLAVPATMRGAQATFEQTGGLHAAAAFTPTGELIALREDVGRHNAVDKVVGHLLLGLRLPFDPGVLLVSGRASFEIMQKAAMAGVTVVAAVSAPSSLAVDFAVEMDMTLVGFLRGERMNVYHDRGRIAG